ncbi:hypothetical protein IV203_035767 [Nitzschia inconspicua]|uniref:Uncharacterized protein n=1 Tax=Nitzschia inconspicua TaxID=303405 RepID=A0A9K3LEU9_9STRA|nr:hypothetical protein IV203_035767 [Nitzschia inconspicua]
MACTKANMDSQATCTKNITLYQSIGLADRVQAKLSKLWDLVAEADWAEEEEEEAKAEEAKDLEGNQQVNEDEEDEEDANDLLDLSYQGN